MTRLFIIACILFTTGNLFGQVSKATATISATIVSPVGVEIYNDINLENFKGQETTTSDLAGTKYTKTKTAAFLKVIGDAFAYDVTIENDHALQRKNGMEGNKEPSGKNESYLSITVNFN